MPSIEIEALEQSPEFRRNFNKVLRFSAGLKAANTALVNDLENTQAQNSTTCLLRFLRDFINNNPSAEAAAPAVAFWRDTMHFCEDLRRQTDRQRTESIHKFIVDCITIVDKDKNLRHADKNALLDRLFADALTRDMIFASASMLSSGVGSFLAGAYVFFSGASSNRSADGKLLPEGVSLVMCGGALIFLSCLIFILDYYISVAARVDAAQDSNKFRSWVQGVASEIARLGYPCEPDDSTALAVRGLQIATALVQEQPAATLNYAPESKPCLAGLELILSPFILDAVDVVLRASNTRRELDTILQFMHERVAPGSELQTAADFYLELKKSDTQSGQASSKTVELKAKWINELSNTRLLTDFEKNDILDAVLQVACCSDPKSLAANRFIDWIHDVYEAVEKIKNPIVVQAMPLQKKKNGYTVMPTV